jgi:hypothetical protein
MMFFWAHEKWCEEKLIPLVLLKHTLHIAERINDSHVIRYKYEDNHCNIMKLQVHKEVSSDQLRHHIQKMQNIFLGPTCKLCMQHCTLKWDAL